MGAPALCAASLSEFSRYSLFEKPLFIFLCQYLFALIEEEFDLRYLDLSERVNRGVV
jgi:hypothetical protein